MFDVIFQERDGLAQPHTETRVSWTGGSRVTLRDLIVEKVRTRLGDAGEPISAPWSIAARLDAASLERETLKAVEKAVTGLNQGGIVVMVDGIQVFDLDAVVELRPTTRIEFLRLVPLKGG